MSDLINRDAYSELLQRTKLLCYSNSREIGFDDGLEVAIQTAKVFPTVPIFGEWISVNDRLPNENGVYLVYGYDMLNHGITFECDARYHCLNDDICKWDLGTHTRLYKVTHWMPLPKPPKEAQYAAD